MPEFTDRDLVCLYLEACSGGIDQSPAPQGRTAVGIADALELGDSTANQVALLDDLAALQDAGVVRAVDRPVVGRETPRTVYGLTEEGRHRAEAVRDRVGDKSVVLTNGTTEEVPLSEVDRYFEDREAPLVTALARLSADGEVPLERHEGEAFVDRTAELERLTDAIEASFTGPSRTVAVGAASGMGKTALVREATDRVAEEYPELVVASGASPAEVTDPYAAFQQAFDVLPEGNAVADLLADARTRATAENPDQAERRREALFEDIGDALREVTMDRPVVVVLDNLQWAGEATRALFEHLATEVNELVYPIAFVGIYREPAVAATEDHPISETLERIDSEGQYAELRLESLSSADTRALVAEVVGRYQLPDGFVDLVYEQTGGNPLFVRETVLHLLETGRVDPGERRYPTSAEAVALPGEVTTQIVRRLENLDDASRDLLRQAAVLGERVPGPVLAEMSDLPAARRREYTDVLVGSRVWEPVGEQAVERVGGKSISLDGGGDVRFVSGGLRDAVVDRLPDSLIEEYHRRAATAFLAVYGEDSDAHAARIAHHFEEAGDDGRAVEYYRRAGDDAEDTYAFEDATEHYERALDIGGDATGVTDQDLAEIHVDLAKVYEKLGEFDATLETAKTGLDLAPSDSRPECRLHGAVADVHIKQGEYDEGRAAANRQREIADRIDDRDQEAGANIALGRVAMERANYDRARECFETTISISRETGVRIKVAHGLHNLGGVEYYQGNVAAARECWEESLAIKQELGDRWEETNTRNNLGVLLTNKGEYEAAREHLERSLEICEEVGDKHRRSYCLASIGDIHRRQGDFERAREHFEESLAIRRETGDKRGEAITLGDLGEIALDRGDYEQARERFEASRRIKDEMGDVRGVAISRKHLGQAARRLGDHEEAREHLEDALSLLSGDADPQLRAQIHYHRAELARVRNDHETAAERVERALALAEEADTRIDRARARTARARLALDRGDLDRAREEATRVREHSEDLGKPLQVARSRRLCGRVAYEEGASTEARAHLRAALKTFEDVGAFDDALETLDLLIACCQSADKAGTTDWVKRAQTALEEAPESTATKHREWVERAAETVLDDDP